MFPQRRLLTQLAPRLAQQMRAPAMRSALQRRLVQTSRPAEEIATENAFIKERQAVKEHAAATTGTLLLHLSRSGDTKLLAAMLTL
jgi:cytochrome c oxidase subunit 6a